MPNLMTVEDLERAALASPEHIANVRIRSLYLTVTYDHNERKYRYRYGRINIAREGVKIILDDG